jgi:hypothetical protein
MSVFGFFWGFCGWVGCVVFDTFFLFGLFFPFWGVGGLFFFNAKGSNAKSFGLVLSFGGGGRFFGGELVLNIFVGRFVYSVVMSEFKSSKEQRRKHTKLAIFFGGGCALATLAFLSIPILGLEGGTTKEWVGGTLLCGSMTLIVLYLYLVDRAEVVIVDAEGISVKRFRTQSGSWDNLVEVVIGKRPGSLDLKFSAGEKVELTLHEPYLRSVLLSAYDYSNKNLHLEKLLEEKNILPDIELYNYREPLTYQLTKWESRERSISALCMTASLSLFFCSSGVCIFYDFVLYDWGTGCVTRRSYHFLFSV